MDRNKMIEIAYMHMGKNSQQAQRETGYIYYHGYRTANLALSLRKMIQKEDNTHDAVMFVGALYHDIGKGFVPHAKVGSVIAKEILAEFCTEKELEEVCEIIAAHQSRNKPNTYPEHIKIVQDADIIDHMGSTEIWLNFIHGTRAEKNMKRVMDYYKTEDYKAYVDEMRSLLNYEISVKIFDERASFVESFVQRCSAEAEGEIFNLQGIL